MLNNSIVINSENDLKELDKRIYIIQMNLGFSSKCSGTFLFRKILINSLSNLNSELSYSNCINILCSNLNKNKYTLRSLITNSFINVNKNQYIKFFRSFFGYQIDYSSITPLNLYDSFMAYFNYSSLISK